LLQIRDLVKVYPGPVAALQGVGMDIPQGMFGLLGPNGAGKTTLMRILAGLLEATSGSVTFEGLDVLAKPEKIWPQLSYLPQDFGFYPHLTGREMLIYLLKLKGVQAPGGLRKLAGELLERVHLVPAANMKLKAWSGGMRQRLGIAQALAGDPSLIIVDEPTAGLDPEERRSFYRLLAELSAGRTVLLSTHIVEDVSVLCSRFVVIRSGRVLCETTPAEAREAIRGRIFAGTVDGGGFEALIAGHRVLQALPREGRNHVRLYEPEGPPPAGFEEAEPTLEDAYLVMMRRDEAGLGNPTPAAQRAEPA